MDVHNLFPCLYLTRDVTALELTVPAGDGLVKNRKNAWIQVAGHPGSFAPAGPNTIWKHRIMEENNEALAYHSIKDDIASNIVPKFYQEVEYKGEFFIEIEDLLQHFQDPSIMDIKMGTRTYLESEVKNPVLRKDLYEKMTLLDPHAPTKAEREQRAITKLRYMQFREQESSTAHLGFRIEAVRKSGEALNTKLKKVKSEEQVTLAVSKFLNFNHRLYHSLLLRLQEIREKFEASPFFMSHELIGSSILIMHDATGSSDAWMIDFAKTLPLGENKQLTHRVAWSLGNREDGYLFGLDNLISIFQRLHRDCNEGSVILEPEGKS